MVALLILLVGAAFTLIGRFYVPGHGLSWPGTYEALVHIWIGYVIKMIADAFQAGEKAKGWKITGLLVALTVLEIIMFKLR